MNDIERIWALPAETIYSPKDTQTVIDYYLKTMRAIESGQKPKKNTAGDDLRLEDIVPVEKSSFKRRF